MDTFSAEKRSACMAKVKSKNTKPELLVRRILTDMGIRYRLHRKNLPGKPDIVVGRLKTVIFVNGCFWHRHENCKYASMPRTNEDFWQKKFQDNVARMHDQICRLEKAGWRVIILWTCELLKREKAEQIIRRFFENNS